MQLCHEVGSASSHDIIFALPIYFACQQRNVFGVPIDDISRSVAVSELLDIPDSQQEEESDLAAPLGTAETYVVSSDWTLETISLQINKGNIDLQPEFQRRAAWDEERKSRLVESFLVSIPVPSIVLAESKLNRGKFLVIDGKQRLLAISEFMSGGVRLRGLKMRPDLNGKVYIDLEPDDRDAFDNATLRTTAIRKWQDEAFLYTIFYRLNSGSLPLSPQELRKALIGGRLINQIEGYLSNSASFKRMFGEDLDRRMRDSELVLRFISFDLFLPAYEGDFKKFLDTTTRYFEAQDAARDQELEACFRRLDRVWDTVAVVFPGGPFKKWLGDKYERVMNRAVFDAVARYFAEVEISDLAKSDPRLFKEAFHELCLDQDFRSSIEKTTKSRQATFHRINAWGVIVANLMGSDFDPVARRVL